MFQELKKRIRVAFIIQLLIGGLIMIPLLWVILKEGFSQGFIPELYAKISIHSGETIEINPGEDLSQYAYKNVRCTFKYVINPVVNFYHTDDPDKVLYTLGYVVVDENMENPFCVYVPPTKQAQMEELMNETWKIKRGESNGVFISTMTVEGIVRNSDSKIYDYYVKALHQLYGDAYAVQEDHVFYIDDESSATGNGGKWKISDFLLVLIVLIPLYFVTVYPILQFVELLFWKKRIYRFIEKYNISKEQLESEFDIAKEVAPNYWISPQYTFYLSGVRVTIIKNKEIVWCYEVNGLRRGLQRYVGLGTIEQKRYRSGLLPGDNTEKVFCYYETNFPHIVIGTDGEKKYLFKHNFTQFLQLKYMKAVKENSPSLNETH